MSAQIESGQDKLSPRRLDASAADFSQQLEALINVDSVADEHVLQTVRDIIAAIRARGDAALLEYSNRFDRVNADDISKLEISQQRLRQALETITPAQKQALQAAADRIRLYHEKQLLESWQYSEADGTVLGQQVTALDRVGLYVPGGKAAYPSTVLMNAVPARVAGVGELIMTVPTPDGEVNELVLAAAATGGVDRVFAVGGAQAVAALAYGTETIPRVDKIVGPGNIYVATAKAFVFGAVGIDMIAGPSEILVIADASTDPRWVAMDLFSQAEHDEDAQSILLCPDQAYIDQVLEAMNSLIGGMERADIIRASINGRGAMIKVTDLQQAVDVANRIAPEHLELSVRDPRALLAGIKHAGAVFMGSYTCEALGDYCAGPNHVLPTAQTARFSSPLGVYDFQKRTSIIHCSEPAAATLGEVASVLARGEGLTAHARSAEYRLKKDG